MDVERWRKWRESGKWVAGNLRLMSQHHRSLHPAQINTPSTPPKNHLWVRGIFWLSSFFFLSFFPFSGQRAKFPLNVSAQVGEESEEGGGKSRSGEGAEGRERLVSRCIGCVS